MTAPQAKERTRGRAPDAIPPPAAAKHGGARANSGRKSAALEGGAADAHIVYAKSRAKKEAFAAAMAELDYKKASGQFVPREDVREAAATAFSTIAQTLRSIPDNIERKLGVTPEIAEEIGILIDDAMNELATELEALHRGAT